MSAHSARVVPFPDNDVGGEIRSGTDALRASVVILWICPIAAQLDNGTGGLGIFALASP